MAEKLAEIVSDLESWRSYESPILGSLKESGLSFQAELVVEKLKGADATDGWHRVYRQTKTEMTLVDALTDREITIRGYQPTNAKPKVVQGGSPVQRDVLQQHMTDNSLYQDVWIGERLE